MKILTAKYLAIFFGLATIAFAISTIVLAVQKADVEDKLNGASNELNDQGKTTTPPSTTSTSVSSSETTSTSTSTSSPEGPTASTMPTDTTTSNQTTTVSNQTTITSIQTTTTSTTQNPDFPNPNEIKYRLPNHVRPWQYKLYLKPDLKTKTYEGTVAIGLSVDKPTNVIALHSKDLRIFGISILEVMNKMRIRVKDYYTDPVRQLFIIEFHEVLRVFVPYTLSVSFRGSLNGLTGFYSSSYTNQNGEEISHRNLYLVKELLGLVNG